MVVLFHCLLPGFAPEDLGRSRVRQRETVLKSAPDKLKAPDSSVGATFSLLHSLGFDPRLHSMSILSWDFCLFEPTSAKNPSLISCIWMQTERAGPSHERTSFFCPLCSFCLSSNCRLCAVYGMAVAAVPSSASRLPNSAHPEQRPLDAKRRTRPENSQRMSTSSLSSHASLWEFRIWDEYPEELWNAPLMLPLPEMPRAQRKSVQ